MKIQIFLNKEGKEASLDLLGEIRLSDGQNTIAEKFTYIDSWLDALEEGANLLKHNDAGSVDLIEEPNPLVFTKRTNYIMISYNDIHIFVSSIEEIYTAIQEVSQQINETKH